MRGSGKPGAQVSPKNLLKPVNIVSIEIQHERPVLRRHSHGSCWLEDGVSHCLAETIRREPLRNLPHSAPAQQLSRLYHPGDKWLVVPLCCVWDKRAVNIEKLQHLAQKLPLAQYCLLIEPDADVLARKEIEIPLPLLGVEPHLQEWLVDSESLALIPKAGSYVFLERLRDQTGRQPVQILRKGTLCGRAQHHDDAGLRDAGCDVSRRSLRPKVVDAGLAYRPL